MSILLDAGLVLALMAGSVSIVLHHRFRRARMDRIQVEANAFGGRLDAGE